VSEYTVCQQEWRHFPKVLVMRNTETDEERRYVPGRTTTRNTKRTVYGNPRPVCEVCGYGIGDKRWHYCPNCGAEVVE
jgi:rubrerythrin